MTFNEIEFFAKSMASSSMSMGAVSSGQRGIGPSIRWWTMTERSFP